MKTLFFKNIEAFGFKPLNMEAYKSLLEARLRLFIETNCPIRKELSDRFKVSDGIRTNMEDDFGKKLPGFVLIALEPPSLENEKTPTLPMGCFWEIRYWKMDDGYQDTLPIKKIYFHIVRGTIRTQYFGVTASSMLSKDPLYKEGFMSFENMDGLIDCLYKEWCSLIQKYYASIISQEKESK